MPTGYQIKDQYFAPGLPQVMEYQHYYPFGMQLEALGYTSGADLKNNYLYNGKELQEDYNLNWYDYGARFYDPVIGRWTTIDPLAEKMSWVSPYVYCSNTPINKIDPDGRLEVDDWYEYQNENGDKSVLWQAGNAKNINVNGNTYSNIGSAYTQNIGSGVSVGYTQNEATSMTFTGIDENNFVAQGTGTGCKVASDQMLANEGVNSNGERINVVNADANGVATTANGNATKGIKAVDNALENGKPIEVGVDYKSKQENNLKPNGDGMTDHFVVVSSKTESLNNGQVTSKTYNFFDPRNSRYGTDATNTLRISNNKLVGYYRSGSPMNIPYTVTTVRRSK